MEVLVNLMEVVTTGIKEVHTGGRPTETARTGVSPMGQSRASSVVPSSVPRVHRKFRFRIFKYWKMSDHNLLFRNSRIEHNIFLASLKHLSKEQEFSI